MSGNEIQNLLVRIEPEGVDETTEDLAEQSDQFEETAETADEQTGRLEDFSQKWQGAMTTIVAGLAIAAAGLLSQVPVLGEALGGIIAVIEAIAFQMDQVLRPVLQPITRGFFQLSGAIFGLKGVAGDIVGILATIGATLSVVAGAALAAATAFGTSLSGVASTLAGLGGTIAGVSAGLVAIAASIGIIIGLLGVLVLELTGVLDFFEQLGRRTRAILDRIWRDLQPIRNTLIEIGNMAIDIVMSFVDDPLGTVTDILGRLNDIVNETWDTVIEIIMQLIPDSAQVSGDNRQIGPGMETGLLDPRGIPGLSQAFEAGQSVRNGQGGGGANISNILNLDGRQVTEDTGRYRVGQTTRRGRGP